MSLLLLSYGVPDFIFGLDRDYPSTVSTIVRTCGKLAPKGAVAGACALCGRCVRLLSPYMRRLTVLFPLSPFLNYPGAYA